MVNINVFTELKLNRNFNHVFIERPLKDINHKSCEISPKFIFILFFFMTNLINTFFPLNLN